MRGLQVARKKASSRHCKVYLLQRGMLCKYTCRETHFRTNRRVQVSAGNALRCTRPCLRQLAKFYAPTSSKPSSYEVKRANMIPCIGKVTQVHSCLCMTRTSAVSRRLDTHNRCCFQLPHSNAKQQHKMQEAVSAKN